MVDIMYKQNIPMDEVPIKITQPLSSKVQNTTSGQYSTVQYSTVQNTTSGQYSTVQYRTLHQASTVQYSTEHYIRPVQYSTVQNTTSGPGFVK
jgi:hypothetical protein